MELEFVREDWDDQHGYNIRLRDQSLALFNFPNEVDITEKEIIEAGELMAAAPRLLAACKGLVAYRDKVGPLNFQLEKADDFIHLMRVAIAEAEGDNDV